MDFTLLALFKLNMTVEINFPLAKNELKWPTKGLHKLRVDSTPLCYC